MKKVIIYLSHKVIQNQIIMVMVMMGKEKKTLTKMIQIIHEKIHCVKNRIKKI